MLEESSSNLDYANKDLFETYCSTCKDLVNENLKQQGLVAPLRRILLVGKLKYENRVDIQRNFDEMVQKINETVSKSSSKLSGLAMIQKSFFYQVAEGSDEALNEVIESIANLVSEEMLYGAKVIRTKSIAFRFFKNWNSCVILSPDFVDLPYEQPEGGEESDIPTLAKMIEKFEDIIFVLASYVRYLKVTDFEESVNDLVLTSVLPFETELENLYGEPYFITVQNYVERYLKPQEYTSYNEMEWPPTGPAHDAKDYFEELDAFEKQIDKSLQVEEDEKKKKARFGSWWWLQ